MKKLSTLLATSHLDLEVVLFVEKNTTIAGQTDHKEHGPEMITKKIRKFF